MTQSISLLNKDICILHIELLQRPDGLLNNFEHTVMSEEFYCLVLILWLVCWLFSPSSPAQR